MRLFLGIPLAPAALSELASAATRLRRQDDGFRWTAPESWHITLAFLGSATSPQYQSLVARLGQLHSPPLSIRLLPLTVFPRTGVLIAGVELTPQLSRLQQQVSAAIAACGFKPESRPYHPHITLARPGSNSRAPRRAPSSDSAGPPVLHQPLLRRPSLPAFTASHFHLYESFLEPSGARYQIRATFPLC